MGVRAEEQKLSTCWWCDALKMHFPSFSFTFEYGSQTHYGVEASARGYDFEINASHSHSSMMRMNFQQTPLMDPETECGFINWVRRLGSSIQVDLLINELRRVVPAFRMKSRYFLKSWIEICLERHGLSVLLW